MIDGEENQSVRRILRKLFSIRRMLVFVSICVFFARISLPLGNPYDLYRIPAWVLENDSLRTLLGYLLVPNWPDFLRTLLGHLFIGGSISVLGYALALEDVTRTIQRQHTPHDLWDWLRAVGERALLRKRERLAALEAKREGNNLDDPDDLYESIELEKQLRKVQKPPDR